MDWSEVKSQAQTINTALNAIVDGLKDSIEELTISDFDIVVNGCEGMIQRIVRIRDKAMALKEKTQDEKEWDELEAIREEPDCVYNKVLDEDSRPEYETFESAALGRRATVSRVYMPHPKGKRLIGREIELESI